MSRRSTYSNRRKLLRALVGVLAIAACGPDRPAGGRMTRGVWSVAS